MNPEDAQSMGIAEGDKVKPMALENMELVELKVRLGDIKRGHLFCTLWLWVCAS